MAAYKFTGGEKLKAVLSEIVKKSNEASLVKVGFFENATEGKNGESIAMIAATMEYGGTIKKHTVQARKTMIYRRVSKDGEFLNDAQFVKRSKSNFATEHDVPEHEVPEYKVPSRPFFRRMIALGKGQWGKDIGTLILNNGYGSAKALALMGNEMSGQLIQSITDQVYEPLKKETIKHKGFDATLIDSGDMKRAVSYEVDE